MIFRINIAGIIGWWNSLSEIPANRFAAICQTIYLLLNFSALGFAIALASSTFATNTAEALNSIHISTAVLVVNSAVCILQPLFRARPDSPDIRDFRIFHIHEIKVTAAYIWGRIFNVYQFGNFVVHLQVFIVATTLGQDIGLVFWALLLSFITVWLFTVLTRLFASTLYDIGRETALRILSGFVLLTVTASLIIWLIFGVNWTSPAGSFDSLLEILGWLPIGIGAGTALDVSGASAVFRIAPLIFYMLFSFIAIAILLFATWHMHPHRSRSAQNAEFGAFEFLPGSSAGIIAGRALTYWVRDPRYWLSLVLAFPIIFLVIGLFAFAGVPTPEIFQVFTPLLALFIAWSIHNDIAFDHSAFWVHVSSLISGRDDRLGRVIAVLLFGIPAIILASVFVASVGQSFGYFFSQLGLGSAVLLGGLGVSSVSSVMVPYPATYPGESAFTQPQNQGGEAFYRQLWSISLCASMVLPPLIAAIVFGTTGPESFAVFIIGMAVGVIALIYGIRIGGETLDKRRIAVLQEVSAF